MRSSPVNAIARSASRFFCAAIVSAIPLSAPMSTSANEVWLDFVSDFHDGNNGLPNGVADWIDELNELADRANVQRFTVEERATIESNIAASVAEVYFETTIDFVLQEPSGEHDVVYFARDNDHPSVSSTNLGSAPADLGNQDTNGYTQRNGNPPGVPKVTTANFLNILESSDQRAMQIAEISAALAGTAAHELGHTFGQLHHFAYSAEGISPANYANTLGIQNQHIQATGSTGITESNRQSQRTLSPFSEVILDISGGSQASPSEENNSLVAGGLISDRREENGSDAGGTIDNAFALGFEFGPTSGLPISFIEADIDGPSSDVDVFSFSVATPTTLISHVFSERLDLGSNEFDSVLELLDGSGTVLERADDIGWDDNQYNDLVSPEGEEDDPFLLNIPLDPGEYFLRVSPATTDVSDSPNPGDVYWLVTALTIDAPALEGDFDRDGFVDAVDYIFWRESEGQELSVAFDGADGDGNGIVDGDDFQVWLAGFGAGQFAVATPEPSSALMALLAFAGLTARRRRSRER